MKSQVLIGLSAVALLVLLAVQYIFIKDTYSTKLRLIDARYEQLAKKALSEFNNRDISDKFDSVLFILDNLALDYIYDTGDSISPDPWDAFSKILNAYEEREAFIRDYVVKAGEEADFSYHLVLTGVSLLDMNYEKKIVPDSLQLISMPEEALQVGRYTHQRNFFRITYDIYINFWNRNRMVLKEMRLILLLTLFMLILVFSVFSLTLRNMLLQKRISDMKTDFINNMTHELKTPLSTISVASSTLGNKKMIKNEERVEELSAVIKKQNKHLAELIDRILDINIWERDQVRLYRQETDIDAWIRDLAGAFTLKNPEVKLELSSDLKSVRAEIDEVHLSTALNNLLSNALKYSHTPCIIRIESRLENESLLIALSDNGPGIKKEELKHIFEKFYRGSEAKKRVIRGLGLGLYYVKQIVEAHGGTLEAESEPGSGSTFTIKIPL